MAVHSVSKLYLVVVSELPPPPFPTSVPNNTLSLPRSGPGSAGFGTHSTLDYGAVRTDFLGGDADGRRLSRLRGLEYERPGETNLTTTREAGPSAIRPRALGSFTDITVVLRNPDDTPITLSFAFIDTVEDVGVVHVYDGDSTSAPLLASLSGRMAPAGDLSSTRGEGALAERAQCERLSVFVPTTRVAALRMPCACPLSTLHAF